jgi:microcystin-dependent protein
MEGTIAVVTCFGAEWAPKNWASCNGQLLPISQNQALFSLLGTTYGGNGVTTFGLPDLRGRRPVSPGQGIGLSNYVLGEMTGTETVTLSIPNLPMHTHNNELTLVLDADSNPGGVTRPVNTYPAMADNSYAASPTAAPNQMVPPTYAVAIGTTGSSQPVPVLMPYLVVNYIICLYGIFPSRN